MELLKHRVFSNGDEESATVFRLVGDRHLEPVVVLTWPPGKIRTAQDFIDMMKLGEQFAATLDAAEVARWKSAERGPATQEKVTTLQTSKEESEGSS